MRNDDFPDRAPNYTQACMVMFGVNLSWILVAIWAIWGLIAAMLVSWGLNHGMTWLKEFRARRQLQSIRRGKSVS